MLDIINRSARRCVKSEALIRCRMNILLFAVLDAVMKSAPEDSQPLNLQTETHLISRPFKAKREYWQAQGQCDYTVWYGEEVHEQAINLVIVETKRPGSVSLGEGQALGYMGKCLMSPGYLRKYRLTMSSLSSYCSPGAKSEQASAELYCIWSGNRWENVLLLVYQ